MANITAVTGVHDWQPQLLKQGPEKVPGFMCRNCRAYRYHQRESDLPLRGCRSDINVSRCGNARLGDYREQEMRLRAEQDARERRQDEADLAHERNRPLTPFEQHLASLLREEQD